ncbi:MAG: bacteriohemerythrin [Methylobacter sp.]|nr:MAG: bacteriohemerythrin [Methylobacter sp.]
MLIWSSIFETNIELVDLQHRKLFELLNKLCDSFEHGRASEALVNEILQELLTYADKHFVDEELLMVRSKVDIRHINIQRMEHSSFIYDIKNLRKGLCTEDDFQEVSEKLVCFITSWLTFHILGTDMIMAAQIRAIEHGATPGQAYESQNTINYDTATIHLMLDSVMELWRISLERCNKLEEKLETILGVRTQSSSY